MARVGAVVAGVGLRERKKQETRQRISDVATAMFLERGFDEVRLTDIAAATGVSPKTLYNYFPTKESMLLDRETPMAAAIRQMLGPEASMASPLDAMVQVILDEVRLYFVKAGQGPASLSQLVRFTDVIEQSTMLRAAQRDMSDRLAQVASAAIAGRTGADPLDPELQIAATAMVGLWGVSLRALRREAAIAATAEAAQVAVASDTRRAAHLLATGLNNIGRRKE